MKPRRVTSRQVAERAGVSRTTVSFVLNGVQTGKVGEPTRQRVLRAAAELGYVPDAAARTLVSGKTGTIGLLVSKAEHVRVDAFVPQTLHSLSNACNASGYRLLVETSDGNRTPFDYAQLVESQRIDGLIVLNPDPRDERLNALIDERYPLVLIGAHPDPRVSTVSVDSMRAMREVTEHLIGLGHRELAFIHYRHIDHPRIGGRMAGFRTALERAGLPMRDSYVRSGDFDAQSGRIAMASLLSEPERPTAVVCGNDTIAIGAISAIAEAGLRCPGDIALAGLDDIPLASFVVPSLTTARFPAEEMATRAAELLFEQLATGRPSARRDVFPTELVIRASSGRCLKRD